MHRGIFTLAALTALTTLARAEPGLSRQNLAKNARFTVTYTVSPKGGAPQVQKFQVMVSGTKGRADYKMDGIGDVRYVANESGVFLYVPANKAAQKMAGSVGMEVALKQAFGDALQQLKGAKKIGSATVSGIPTDVYRQPRTGTTIYLGTKPGFTLPVKVEMSNEGGKRLVLVTGIQLDTPIPAAQFALPPGTKVIDSKGASGVGSGIPGVK